jgi:hypothetical protein
LTLIFGIRRPSDRYGSPFSVNIDEVARGYRELLHRLIIDSYFSVPDVSLLSVSYP